MIQATDSKLYKPGVNYYKQHDFISNSTFGAFKDWLNNAPKLNLENAFAFGNLVDALMTESHLVDRAARSVMLADGDMAYFTPEQMKQADGMIAAAYADPMAAPLLKQMDYQYEQYVDSFEFEYHGNVFTLPIRIKMDGHAGKIKTGIDIKTTSCTTRKGFIDSLYDLHYDRQSALYMDVSGCDKFWFIGLGKIPDRRGKYSVFIYAFKRGDEFYRVGKAKYSLWAYLYNAFIYNLDLSLF